MTETRACSVCRLLLVCWYACVQRREDQKKTRQERTREDQYPGCIAHTRGGIACSNISPNIPILTHARTHARTPGTQSYDSSLFNVFDASLSQDAIGAPLEFLEVVDTPFELDGSGEAHGFTAATMKYTNENNRFELKRGQWTDDAAMGLCMASDAANTRLRPPAPAPRTCFCMCT